MFVDTKRIFFIFFESILQQWGDELQHHSNVLTMDQQRKDKNQNESPPHKDLHEGIEHYWFPRYVTSLIGCFSTHSLFSTITFLLVFGKKGLHLVDHWMLSSRLSTFIFASELRQSASKDLK